jgi:hypothetical protein
MQLGDLQIPLVVYRASTVCTQPAHKPLPVKSYAQRVMIFI